MVDAKEDLQKGQRGNPRRNVRQEVGEGGRELSNISRKPTTTTTAMAQAPPPAPAAPPRQDQEDDYQDLTAVGFLFDAAASKTWARHAFPTSPSTTGPNTPKVEVEVKVIKDDGDGPGALQTGQRTWPAAPFLADYLVRKWPNRDARRKCHVLELGAGCGLVGLTLAQLPGVATVVMTDHDPGTLTLIKEGIARNMARITAGACECGMLTWGKNMFQGTLYLQRGGREVREEDELLVVGSDLIYAEDVVEPLFRTVMGTCGTTEASKASFLLCGSFPLGDAIERKIEEMTHVFKLKRTEIRLEKGTENWDMWLHCYTLVSGDDCAPF